MNAVKTNKSNHPVCNKKHFQVGTHDLMSERAFCYTPVAFAMQHSRRSSNCNTMQSVAAQAQCSELSKTFALHRTLQ